MNNDQFNHALSLTRVRGVNAEAARLHFVEGMNVTDAAKQAGASRPAASRAINSIKTKVEGIKMSAKKIGVYLADSSLEFLSIVQNRHDTEVEMNISSAVNLMIQLGRVIVDDNLRLSTGELLLCCDVLNGGAILTEFDSPDSVSIKNALDSMRFSLLSACDHAPGIFEKWDVEEQKYYQNIDLLDVSELFTVAIASRQFWSGKKVGDKKPPSDCEGWREWAAQWCDH